MTRGFKILSSNQLLYETCRSFSVVVWLGDRLSILPLQPEFPQDDSLDSYLRDKNIATHHHPPGTLLESPC